MTLQQKDFDGLVERGLSTMRVDESGYTTYKYAKKVFYDNLWHLDPLLLECRGIVFDKDGVIAQRPFQKTFNVGENGTKLDDDKLYLVCEKVNGFMMAASYHNDELLVSTTGTTTSDFVELARKHLYHHSKLLDVMTGHQDLTYLFEVCDPSDPHIVQEEYGLHALGARNKETGRLIPSLWVPQDLDLHKPASRIMTGTEAKSLAKQVKHEGFVLYDPYSYKPEAKIKSPHYLGKKAFMRMGQKGCNMMFDHPEVFRQRLDEEFYQLLDDLRATFTKNRWLSFKEVERRELIERYFKSGGKF